MKIKIVKVIDGLNKGRIIFNELDARPLIGKTFDGFYSEQFNRYELNINGEMISFHLDEVKVMDTEPSEVLVLGADVAKTGTDKAMLSLMQTNANGSKIVVGSQTF